MRLLLPRRSIAPALLLAGVLLPARAQVLDEYEYAPHRIYPVRTALGITTQIEFDAHDDILDYSTGFSSGWELDRRGNVFYLKPRNVDVDTNMLVRTAARSYVFELKVVATDWTTLEQARRAGVQYKVAFRYPGDTGIAGSAAAEPVSGPSIQLEKDRVYNFDYEFATRTRLSWLIPVNVYDDGRFTYVRMSDFAGFPSGNFPAVFGREREDGEDFVVNTTVQGSTLIVHGTHPFLVIRHGRNVVGLRRKP